MSHFGFSRKSAHHLQGRDRVLFSNRDVAVQPRVNDPLADDILDVEQVIELLLRSQRWCCSSGDKNGLADS